VVTDCEVDLFDAMVLDELLADGAAVAGQNAKGPFGHAGLRREQTKLEQRERGQSGRGRPLTVSARV
jgi:hypothetical protein